MLLGSYYLHYVFYHRHIFDRILSATFTLCFPSCIHITHSQDIYYYNYASKTLPISLPVEQTISALMSVGRAARGELHGLLATDHYENAYFFTPVITDKIQIPAVRNAQYYVVSVYTDTAYNVISLMSVDYKISHKPLLLCTQEHRVVNPTVEGVELSSVCALSCYRVLCTCMYL